MAIAKLYCTFFLLLYLQGNYAQQGLTNNQNVGVNNAIGLPQQALLRTNTPNNINQIPNGGLNINLPQQINLQQANLQQPLSANLQGNFQQSLSLPANLQQQGASVPFLNLQINKQGLAQLPPGLAINPSQPQTGSIQFSNAGCRQNIEIPQQQNNQIPQQNLGSGSNVPMSQTQNMPLSSNSLAEIAALKGQPSLLSLFAYQNSAQSQQNQQITAPNLNPAQNQLTDAQKQHLVRSLQPSQSSRLNQPGSNFVQTEVRVVGPNNQPSISLQSQPVSPQQPPAIVTPVRNQPQFITVQAQPLSSYIQNQSPQVVQGEDPSILSRFLSEIQPNDSQYTVCPYQVQQKGSKSNLKSLIPLIINLLREKNGCGCHNCGCPNNACGNNNMQEPTIFSGYSSQKNYSQGTEQSFITNSDVEEAKSEGNTKEQKSVKNVKKNMIVNVDSEEMSEENDSEYTDDSEGD